MVVSSWGNDASLDGPGPRGTDASSDGPGPTSVDDLVVGEAVSIEDVMLEDEEDVEKDGEEAQAKFRHVTEDAAPVVVIVRLNV